MLPLKTGRKLNVRTVFRQCPGRLLKVCCASYDYVLLSILPLKALSIELLVHF